jgi:hypothetical protein
MFNLIVKYFGFLKFIPGLALVFDALLNLWTLIANPKLLGYIDDIEKQVLEWDNTNSTIHKYGGLQLNLKKRELGHIHSNGILDILLSRKLKEELMQQDSRIKKHHSFIYSGWISFYIKDAIDKEFAIELLALAYKMHSYKELNKLNIV